MKRRQAVAGIPLLGMCIVGAGLRELGFGAGKLNVLCTTFSIYQITRNVAHGVDSVQVELMLPAHLGCPHDYALTPQDIRKITNANILVINGLGLEEFLGPTVTRANPKLKIIDGSAGISGLLSYNGVAMRRDATQGHNHAGGQSQTEKVNPHLFASPRMVARIALSIAGQLSKIDPAGAPIYSKNAQAYTERINRLADEFAALGQRLGNRRIVTQHGVFDYLARDAGLEVVAVVRPHAGQEPSAAELLALIKAIKAREAGAIFTEPQYPDRAGKTIAREAGIPAASLDPVATGPSNAPLGYYEAVMRDNMRTLEKVLGAK